MADFNIQRGQATIASSSASVTITAGTEYTAPASITKAFIRITSVGYISDGGSAAFGGQTDYHSPAITNPGNLLTSITFTRADTPTQAINIEWEIWEYTGSAGGANEFKVLGQELLSATGATTTVDSSAWTPANDADVLPFITSQNVNDASSSRGDAPAMMYTADWISASNLVRVTRANTARTSRVSVAAVEFTGSNWTIQKITHTFSASDTDETASITTVGAITDCFTHLQMRCSDSAIPEAMNGYAWLSSTTQATLNAEYVNTATNATLWIAENSSGLSTQQVSGTWSTSATDPDTTDVSITAVSATAETAITGIGARINATENDTHQCSMGARLTSTSNVRLFRGISDRQRIYRFEVIEFPSAATGITGSLNETLDDFTSTASGIVGHNGSLSETLDNFTLTASGIVGHNGSLNETLEDFTLTASGTVSSGITGSLNETLDDFTLTSSGIVGHNGSLSETLEDFTLTSSGIVGHTGSLSETLEDFTLTASGTVSSTGVISGSLSEVLEDFTLTSSGIVGHIGSLSETLDDFTVTASGNVLGAGGGSAVIVTSPLIYSNGNETALPIYVSVSSNGGLIGQTINMYVRDSSTPGNYLDFNDSTFKSSGWTNQFLVLTDNSGGLYTGTIDISNITNLPTSDLILEHHISGSISAVSIGNIVFTTRAIWGNPRALTVPKFLALK